MSGRNDDAISRMDRDAFKRFEVWIARQSNGRAQVRDLKQLSGGAIQENWWLKLDLEGGDWPGSHDLVLRKDAPSNVAVSHGRAEEFAILQAAHAAGVAVPVPCVLCEDTEVLGTPFFLMHRVSGTAAGHKLAKSDPNETLAKDLGRNLARIHAIPDSPELAFVTKPAVSPALATIADYRVHLNELPDRHPSVEWGLSWLEAHAPETVTSVFCHRDYRTGNYMVDDGILTAVLDWEFAGWSDPIEDIGWLTAKCWRFGADDREVGGIGSLDEFLRGYEDESGRSIDRDQIAYWQVMAHVRWAVIALQQADRFVSGGERNLELALTAHIVPELELEILSQTTPDLASDETNAVVPRYPAPSDSALLDIAREVLKGDIVDALDGDTKYKALMIANAMAIVSRQISDGTSGAETQDDLVSMADRIRSGIGTSEDHAALLGMTKATLRTSNPRALA